MTHRSNSGWIGVDLDGTLAKYDHFIGPTHIGEPIPMMVDRVKDWLSQGYEVRIMTARVGPHNPLLSVDIEEVVMAIEAWCLEHIGEVLPVTCTKDYHMIALIDDRAYHVFPNTGQMPYEFQP